MAAPDHVQIRSQAKYYESPPSGRPSWWADRPGEISEGIEPGPGLGCQGPDQGYALKLVGRFEDRVRLGDGERWEDAAAGCVCVGLKRASLFGRAPVIHDLEIAFRIWGFLDESVDAELAELRRPLFARVDNPHHYLELRRIIDAVPAEELVSTPDAVARAHETNWKSLIDVDGLTARTGGDHRDQDD